MDIFNAIAVALSLFVASPNAHQYFENAPPGAFEVIPLGAACGPMSEVSSIVSQWDPPEQIVESVQVDENINLHLSLAPTDHTTYTVFVEFVAEGMACILEMQGEAGNGA